MSGAIEMEQVYPYITHRQAARLREEVAAAVDAIPPHHNRVRGVKGEYPC